MTSKLERDARARDERERRWRREFPYRWDADEYASRRTFLRFTVYTSGAVFLSTGFLAAWNAVRPPARGEPREIDGAAALPVGRALYFEYPAAGDQAILLNLPGTGLVAYSMKCTHLSCAVYHQAEQGRLYCPCHDGVFDPATGEPVAGPPRRRLPRIELRRDGDRVLAVREVP